MVPAVGFIRGTCSMIARLVALDDGPDIMLDCAMVVVGRHPACDARLDSLRVSRHHCCMMHENGEVVVRDLGSTNGIRINGQRVEMGRLIVRRTHTASPTSSTTSPMPMASAVAVSVVTASARSARAVRRASASD